MPHLLEAGGQDVLEEPSDELRAIDHHLPPTIRAALADKVYVTFPSSHETMRRSLMATRKT